MSARLPGFLVVGAQKAGTTTLDAWLGAEPGVCTAVRKETHFFCRDDRYRLGLEWYAAQFPGGPCETLGEVDPDYLFFPGAAARIREALPAVRLVFVFRQPLERAWSHYRMTVQRGLEPLPFAEALDSEPQRLRQGGEQARIHHSYLARGRYAEQLARYREIFAADRMYFVKFDELFDASTGPATYRAICDFLEIRATLDPARLAERRNPAGGTRSRWINRVLWQRQQWSGLRRLVRRAVPSSRLRYRMARGLYDWNRSARSAEHRAPAISPGLAVELCDEVAALSRMTGLALDDWAATLGGLARNGRG